MSEKNSVAHLIEKYTVKFFENNVQLASGQRVLVITDNHIDPDVSRYLRDAAANFTGTAEIYVLQSLTGSYFEPPEDLDEKVRACDVIISPTGKSLFHTQMIEEACKNGVKFFAMTGATVETLYNGAATADFLALEPGVLKKADLLSRAQSIKITTANGTDFTADITGRTANAETGIGRKGKRATFPDIEINTSIIESSGKGRIVIDGSIGGIGVLEEPVILTVKSGKVVDFSGGREANRLKSIIAALEDENMLQIAEIGIGLNPHGSIRGVIIEDESMLGSAHIGLGNNIFMGGKSRAKSHIDLVFLEPKIYLDDRLFIDNKTHFPG